MSVRHRWRSSRAGVRSTAVGLGLVIASGVGIGGCSDHRMSLGEFLDTQRRSPVQRPDAAEQQRIVTELGRFIGDYRVGPSDELAIVLHGANGTPLFPPLAVRVDREGTIELPAAGVVKVLDMPLEDVEDAVKRAYIPGVYREATCFVTLVTAEPTNVFVIGAVATPGLVPLRRTERNLLFAIASAGGASESASGYATLRRLRDPGQELTLNLRDPVQLRAALTLDPLEHGDIVTVHAAMPNEIFVGGLVNVAGRQAYPPGVDMTVLQVLAAAGGLRTDVFPSEGTLVRRLPNGQDAHVKLNLNRIARGDDPNFMLAAGDILWVPETAGTRIWDFVNRSVFFRFGATVTYNVRGIEFMNRRDLGFGGSSVESSVAAISALGGG